MADVLTELKSFIDGEEKDFVSPEHEEWFNEDMLLYDYEEEYQNPLVTHISSID